MASPDITGCKSSTGNAVLLEFPQTVDWGSVLWGLDFPAELFSPSGAIKHISGSLD